MTITKDYILFYGDDWPSNFALSPITVYDDFWGAGKRESSLEREIDVYGDIQWWDYKHDLPRATNMLGELLTKLRDEIE